MTESYVIVGAGHAGGQAAASLRSNGFSGAIVMIGEEPHLPYQRPPLSKKFLAGEIPQEKTYLKPGEFYQDQSVDLHLNSRAVALHREQSQVELADGSRVDYHKLLLCTGSVVRKLPVPGADLKRVHYLRTINDVLGIQADLAAASNLVVVGAGYIGLEVAAVAVARGLKVTILEREARPLCRVAGPETANFYRQVHRDHGVDIRCDTTVASFGGEDRVNAVVSTTGESFPADLVVVGVGILPATALAEQAGLAVDNGIRVDEYTRTSDPKIFAAGDCTSHHSDLYGAWVRLESVQNALDQARTAAAAMCDKPVPYNAVPRFWSDQYDLKLQIAGLCGGFEETVVRGDPANGKFSVFYLREGLVLAADCINQPQEFMLARKLIEARERPDPAKLADTTVALKSLMG